MKRKLKIISLLVIVAMLFAFSGCYTKKEKTQPVDQNYQFAVTVSVNCAKNLIFSRYDVDVFFDGRELGKLNHGDSKDFSCRANEGTYTIKFAEHGSNGVYGTVKAEILADTKLTYNISCYKDKIEVETVSVDADVELTVDQVKAPVSAKDLKYNKDYRDVVKLFEEAGFTNIITEKNPDLIIGLLANENELDKVSIDGKDEFAEGEVFDNNAEVRIIYHTYPEQSISESKDEQSQVESKTESSLSESSMESSKETKSEYEYAFFNEGKEYDIIFMFDEDSKVVAYFLDWKVPYEYESPMYGTYSGEFDSGVDMNWENYESGWHEKFVWKKGSSKATYYDHNGFDYDYKTLDIELAQKALDKIV